jgi:hypothetical protein
MYFLLLLFGTVTAMPRPIMYGAFILLELIRNIHHNHHHYLALSPQPVKTVITPSLSTSKT